MYLVRTEFHAPVELTTGALAELREREAAAALLLQKRGVLQSLWREARTSCAWGIWIADNEAELRTAMETLPCFPYMVVESRLIITHPNSVHAQQETSS